MGKKSLVSMIYESARWQKFFPLGTHRIHWIFAFLINDPVYADDCIPVNFTFEKPLTILPLRKTAPGDISMKLLKKRSEPECTLSKSE